MTENSDGPKLAGKTLWIPAPPPEFVHIYLIKNFRPEVRRFLRLARKIASRVNMDAVILHNDDGSCCAIETWDLTCKRLLSDFIAKGKLNVG